MTLFTLDIGQGKAHIYDSDLDKHYEKRDEDDLINLNIPGIKTNDIIVVEDSHMRESDMMKGIRILYSWVATAVSNFLVDQQICIDQFV